MPEKMGLNDSCQDLRTAEDAIRAFESDRYALTPMAALVIPNPEDEKKVTGIRFQLIESPYVELWADMFFAEGQDQFRVLERSNPSSEGWQTVPDEKGTIRRAFRHFLKRPSHAYA